MPWKSMFDPVYCRVILVYIRSSVRKYVTLILHIWYIFWHIFCIYDNSGDIQPDIGICCRFPTFKISYVSNCEGLSPRKNTRHGKMTFMVGVENAVAPFLGWLGLLYKIWRHKLFFKGRAFKAYEIDNLWAFEFFEMFKNLNGLIGLINNNNSR